MVDLSRRGLLGVAIAAPLVPYLPKSVAPPFTPSGEPWSVFSVVLRALDGQYKWHVFTDLKQLGAIGGGDFVMMNNTPMQVVSITEYKR